MNIWILIFLCGIITFTIRFLPLSGILKFKVSGHYLRLIQIIPIVVLTPIIFQAVFFISDNQFLVVENSKVYAAILSVFISILLKNVIYTIIIGMMSFWIIDKMFVI